MIELDPLFTNFISSRYLKNINRILCSFVTDGKSSNKRWSQLLSYLTGSTKWRHHTHTHHHHHDLTGVCRVVCQQVTRWSAASSLRCRPQSVLLFLSPSSNLSVLLHHHPSSSDPPRIIRSLVSRSVFLCWHGWGSSSSDSLLSFSCKVKSSVACGMVLSSVPPPPLFLPPSLPSFFFLFPQCNIRDLRSFAPIPVAPSHLV